MVICLFCLSGLMGCLTYDYIHTIYIIPDNYEGFLAIHYNCAGGQPLEVQDRTLTVEFNQDGTFCASNDFFPTKGTLEVQTISGQDVPYFGLGWNDTGYGLLGGDTYGIGGNTRRNPTDDKLVFSIYWVGDAEYWASIRNTAIYAEELEIFLEDRFGVPPLDD
jgi:hypothetical protein